MRTSFFTRIFDLIAPRTCSLCGRRLSVNESTLCATCHLHLPFTDFWRSPYDNEMARLFWGRIPLAGGRGDQRPSSVERVAALFFYESHAPASRIIYEMKYHGQRDTAMAMGVIAAKTMAVEGFFEGIDVIVPIPLTRAREWQRGYNQSKEVALGVKHVTGIPLCNNMVKRVSFDESQTQKMAWERAQNVENAFRLTNAAKAEGRHILIVDDIVTTGATVSSCAQELCKARNVRISVLSLGYTSHGYSAIANYGL